eukprot:NODE_945_length_2856_cov_0.287631.p3 type:complete len:143 gc:universal NODE_945_length_2856_cov_0.287631:1556-1128(-)
MGMPAIQTRSCSLSSLILNWSCPSIPSKQPGTRSLNTSKLTGTASMCLWNFMGTLIIPRGSTLLLPANRTSGAFTFCISFMPAASAHCSEIQFVSAPLSMVTEMLVVPTVANTVDDLFVRISSTSLSSRVIAPNRVDLQSFA